MELFSECRVSVLQYEKTPGDWLHNNMNILNTTHQTLKNGWMVNFVLCVSYHNSNFQNLNKM